MVKRIIRILDKAILLYKPIAVSIFLLGFISINYITHTILLVAIGVFGYGHIRNYISGVFFKINPLIHKGTVFNFENSEGEIKSLLPFGMIMNTESGEQYINYFNIEKKGFAVKSNEEDNVLRQTLFLRTSLTKEQIIDTLFDNPILDFNEKPILKNTEKEGQLKLQYSMENGAATEDLVAFLEEQDIETSLTNSTN